MLDICLISVQQKHKYTVFFLTFTCGKTGNPTSVNYPDLNLDKYSVLVSVFSFWSPPPPSLAASVGAEWCLN